MARTFDPYTKAYYVVEIDTVRVAEFQEVTGLGNETEVVSYSQGGENEFETKLRGRNKYTHLTFKHGITLLSPAIWAWRESTIHRKTPPMLNLSVIMLDVADREVTRWVFRECWPVKWIGPDYKYGESTLAIETLEVAHSGFYFEHDPDHGPTPRPRPEPDPEPEEDGKTDDDEDDELEVTVEPAESEIYIGDNLRFICKDKKGTAVKWKWKIEDEDKTGRDVQGIFREKGDRKVVVTAENASGKTATAEAKVKVKLPPFEIAITPDKSRTKKGGKLRFAASAKKGGPIEKYEWTIEEKQHTDATPEETFSVVGERVVKLKGTDPHGQTAEDAAQVTVFQAPFRIAIDPEMKEVKVGEKVKFKGVAKEGGPIKTYAWTIEGKTFTTAEPEVEFKVPGDRPVKLKGTDDDGQEDTADAKVRVKDGCPDWKPTFTWVRDPKIWNNYILELPDKGPNGENIAYIHWDFGKQQADIVTRFRKQQKKPKYAFVKSGDRYEVKVLLRLQGFEHCAWVITDYITPERTKDVHLKAKRSPAGVKWHYNGPEDKWYEAWEKK